MSANADFASGFLCLIVTLGLIVLHIITGKKAPFWANYPADFRVALFIGACAFIYRGVDFIALGLMHTADPKPGEITSPGFMALLVLTYLVARWSYHTACKVYPESMWARIRVAERLAQWGSGALGTLYLRGVKVAPPGGTMHDDAEETAHKLEEDLHV